MVLLDSDFSRRKGLYKMTIEMLKGKIHRATVVQAELDYVGSITVDEELLEAAGILEYEKSDQKMQRTERHCSCV